MKDLLTEITNHQVMENKINVISNEVVQKARSPSELKKFLLGRCALKKRVKISENEEKVSQKKKKIVPLLPEVDVVVAVSDGPSTSSLAIQPAPTTSVRPPRPVSPVSPVIQVDLTTPPPRPISPVIRRSTHKRTASSSKSASTPSSQPNWDDEDFTSSQKDAFSSAFAAHRRIVRSYKNAESAVRAREKRIKQLESCLAVERAAYAHETQVAKKCYAKLKLVDDTFSFKGGHESSGVV
jgi:hypothetical protein